MSQIRCIVADNPSPMTLDGTRTYIVGTTHLAVIDPGPLSLPHINTVAAAVGNRAHACVMVTHAHPDHADGAHDLAARLRAELLTPGDGQTIATDAGDLTALATPGHTPDHMSFLLDRERAVFCGDLMMGGMDTALVALPEGDLGDYLDSLNRIRGQRPSVIYPAHGPAITEPDAAIERYIRHRMERLAQVTNALRTGPHTPAALVEAIYGAQLDTRLRFYAESAVEAYLAYLEEAGEAGVRNGEWNLT